MPSTAKKLGKIYGYEIREPYDSELEYFKTNQNVGGMAREDGRIILNPYAKFNEIEKQSVLQNEAIRLYLRENDITPMFPVTMEQNLAMKDYPGNDVDKLHTILQE